MRFVKKVNQNLAQNGFEINFRFRDVVLPGHLSGKGTISLKICTQLRRRPRNLSLDSDLCDQEGMAEFFVYCDVKISI